MYSSSYRLRILIAHIVVDTAIRFCQPVLIVLFWYIISAAPEFVISMILSIAKHIKTAYFKLLDLLKNMHINKINSRFHQVDRINSISCQLDGINSILCQVDEINSIFHQLDKINNKFYQLEIIHKAVADELALHQKVNKWLKKQIAETCIICYNSIAAEPCIFRVCCGVNVICKKCAEKFLKCLVCRGDHPKDLEI
jgi:hypothetical protein